MKAHNAGAPSINNAITNTLNPIDASSVSDVNVSSIIIDTGGDSDLSDPSNTSNTNDTSITSKIINISNITFSFDSSPPDDGDNNNNISAIGNTMAITATNDISVRMRELTINEHHPHNKRVFTTTQTTRDTHESHEPHNHTSHPTT